MYDEIDDYPTSPAEADPIRLARPRDPRVRRDVDPEDFRKIVDMLRASDLSMIDPTGRDLLDPED